MNWKMFVPDFCLWTLATNYHYFSAIENCWMLLSRMMERSNIWPIIIFIFRYWIRAFNTIVCSSQNNVCIRYWYWCIPINTWIQVLYNHDKYVLSQGPLLLHPSEQGKSSIADHSLNCLSKVMTSPVIVDQPPTAIGLPWKIIQLQQISGRIRLTFIVSQSNRISFGTWRSQWRILVEFDDFKIKKLKKKTSRKCTYLYISLIELNFSRYLMEHVLVFCWGHCRNDILLVFLYQSIKGSIQLLMNLEKCYRHLLPN